MRWWTSSPTGWLAHHNYDYMGQTWCRSEVPHPALSLETAHLTHHVLPLIISKPQSQPKQLQRAPCTVPPFSNQAPATALPHRMMLLSIPSCGGPPSANPASCPEPAKWTGALPKALLLLKAASRHLHIVNADPKAGTFKFHFLKSASLQPFILQLILGTQCALGGGIFVRCCSDYWSFRYSPLFSEYKIVLNDIFVTEDNHDIENSEGEDLKDQWQSLWIPL